MEGHLSTFTSMLDRQLTGYVMFFGSSTPLLLCSFSFLLLLTFVFGTENPLSSLSFYSSREYFCFILFQPGRRQRSIILTSIRNMQCILHHPQSAAHAYSICHSWFSRSQPILVLRHFHLSLAFDLCPFCLRVTHLHSLLITCICSILNCFSCITER
jgi:hypothetical protein